MKVSISIFLRSLALYLVFTLPTLLIPIMYMMSAIFALTYGLIAGVLFCIVFWLIIQQRLPVTTTLVLLCLTVIISVLVAFQMMEICGSWKDIWNSGGYLLFPFAAMLSGCIQVYVARDNIEALLHPEAQTPPATPQLHTDTTVQVCDATEADGCSTDDLLKK